jgi:hypothetical protein
MDDFLNKKINYLTLKIENIYNSLTLYYKCYSNG